MNKKLFFTIGTYLAIALFLLHWVIVVLLMVPSKRVRNIVSQHIHPFQTNFVAWKFFTPPFTYNDRLYFIIQDTILPNAKPDTIEVLANIALQKQLKAPFNANENVIDHLVNNNVARLKRTVWRYKKTAYNASLSSMDSLYGSEVINRLQANESYAMYVATLTNYCKAILLQKNSSLKNKAVKIIIRQREIRPFKSIGDTAFVAKETFIYETSFKPLTQ